MPRSWTVPTAILMNERRHSKNRTSWHIENSLDDASAWAKKTAWQQPVQRTVALNKFPCVWRIYAWPVTAASNLAIVECRPLPSQAPDAVRQRGPRHSHAAVGR